MPNSVHQGSSDPAPASPVGPSRPGPTCSWTCRGHCPTCQAEGLTRSLGLAEPLEG